MYILDSENAISNARFVQVPHVICQGVKWTVCSIPLDLRASLNSSHICEQLFKIKFQATFLDRCW